jgi:hypothetical protein
MDTKKRLRYWGAFVLAAVLLHLVLFVGLRQSFFEVFRKSIDESPGASSPQASFPDAIVAITIEVEGEEPDVEPVDARETPRPPNPNERPTQPGRGDSPIASVDILDITGEAQAPIPSERSGRDVAVPPRPIEITWPETENLGHCLELQITIMIRVSETGEVRSVRAVDGGLPPDCVEAALEAARRIRFTPGLIKGKPAEMTTQLRIDFRRKG